MLLSSLLESAKPHASVLLSSCTLSHSLYSLFQGRPAALLPISERDRCVHACSAAVDIYVCHIHVLCCSSSCLFLSTLCYCPVRLTVRTVEHHGGTVRARKGQCGRKTMQTSCRQTSWRGRAGRRLAGSRSTEPKGGHTAHLSESWSGPLEREFGLAHWAAGTLSVLKYTAGPLRSCCVLEY